MATDFYSLSQKVPQEVKDRGKYHIAQSVFFRGERGVVIGKYWRRRTNEMALLVSIWIEKHIPQGADAAEYVSNKARSRSAC